MKLLLCLECGDWVTPRLGRVKFCQCRKTAGQYVDEVNAEVSGPFVAFGMNSNDIIRHDRNAKRGIFPEPYSEEGYVEAWAMPKNPGRIKRFDSPTDFTVMKR